MSQPPNLPEIIQARLKLGLFNWGKRTIIWTLALGLLTAVAPGLKFILIAWLIFSALSLAGLLLGLKLAQNLKTGGAGAFMGTMGNMGQPSEPRHAGGHRPEVDEDHAADFPPAQAHSGRAAVSDEIIEIEAEVLPPEKDRA